MMSLSIIRQSGQGLDKNVTINIVNAYKRFQIAFDGDTEGDLFSTHGDVSGSGLQISDNAAVPSLGKSMSLHDYFHGNSIR